jgi:hypothetical protein
MAAPSFRLVTGINVVFNEVVSTLALGPATLREFVVSGTGYRRRLVIRIARNGTVHMPTYGQIFRPQIFDAGD